MRAESLDKPLIGIYGVRLQAVEPPHRYRSKAGRKDLTHQSFVLGVDGHSLIKLAHILYGVRPTIIEGERKLMEPPR